MKEKHLKYLVCPDCKGDVLISEVQKQNDDDIEEGILECSKCSKKYDIIRHIPRFSAIETYADNFGLEWTMHARTQCDSYTGVNITETRFFEETKWPRNLNGQIILEVGGGSGRFTEQSALTGAMVVSLDLSYAVDANFTLNGGKDNVLIVQGDIYKMPFRENFFDKAFCFGTLQHTPDVERAFMVLPRYLKPCGSLVIDIYAKETVIKRLLTTKYWIRPITRHLAPAILYKWCRRYIEFMWPIAKLINKIPYIGKRITWRLLIWDYRDKYNLPEEMLKEWAMLEIFDMLSPKYDSPQSFGTVKKWFENAGLRNASIHCYSGYIEGRGIKP